jgi:hypothetical protein
VRTLIDTGPPLDAGGPPTLAKASGNRSQKNRQQAQQNYARALAKATLQAVEEAGKKAS